MRKDMGKVLTERPRYMGHGSNQPQRHDRKNIDYWDEDEAPVKWQSTGRRRQYGYNHKHFSDLLGPLYGYLRRSVGRRWDDVYSEICKSVPGTGTLALHIRGHFEDAVETKPTFKDGIPYTSDGRYRVSGYRRAAYYVDPDGILREAPKEKRIRYKREPHVHIYNKRAYKKIDGVWYEAVLVKHNLEPINVYIDRIHQYGSSRGATTRVKTTLWPAVRDCLFGHVDINNLYIYYGRSGYYCAKKRQLSSKEIQRLPDYIKNSQPQSLELY